MPALTRAQASKNRSGTSGRGGGGSGGGGGGPFGHMGKQFQSTQRRLEKFFNRYNPTIWIPRLCFNHDYLWILGCIIAFLEVFLCIFVIKKVPYTEIDWSTYMQQSFGFLNGSWDYSDFRGDTGPLVYPAGHLYIYSMFRMLTDGGSNILLAQYIFAGLYVISLLVIFRIYHHSKKLPPYVLLFMCFGSYRVHSIFILRLFNDPIAMLLFYVATLLWLNDRWTIGCIIYSVAVSVKMNILMFAPALFILLIARMGFFKTMIQIAICAAVQVGIAFPFLITNPKAYLLQAFNFGRVFLFEWTVNWKWVGERVFLDRRFHLLLLFAHLLFLALFSWRCWLRSHGGIVEVLKSKKKQLKLTANDIIFPLFTCNFIGVMFARSLHYQFYAWYYHTIPFLFWSTGFPPVMSLAAMGTMELVWNLYPSSFGSSLSLQLFHLLLLVGLFVKNSKIHKVATD